MLPAMSIGLAPYFSLAVLKGLFQRGGKFNRTPKFGISDDLPVNRFRVAVDSHAAVMLMINFLLLTYTLMPVFCLAARNLARDSLSMLVPTGILDRSDP